MQHAYVASQPRGGQLEEPQQQHFKRQIRPKPCSVGQATLMTAWEDYLAARILEVGRYHGYWQSICKPDNCVKMLIGFSTVKYLFHTTVRVIYNCINKVKYSYTVSFCLDLVHLLNLLNIRRLGSRLCFRLQVEKYLTWWTHYISHWAPKKQYTC
jgi:hypothetical protein